jgi:NADH-quinone oxidoreductase subunit J
MAAAAFFLFAALALGSAVVVVTHRNPVYSTMSLVVTLVSIAALFVLLGAPFIATLQVLIYTGAIVVLFLFVLMLLAIGREQPGPRLRAQKVAAGLGALAFGAVVALATWRGYGRRAAGALTPDMVSLRALAEELFSAWLLPFELVGLLLLVAVIAATVAARKAPAPSPGPPPEGGR